MCCVNRRPRSTPPRHDVYQSETRGDAAFVEQETEEGRHQVGQHQEQVEVAHKRFGLVAGAPNVRDVPLDTNE